MNRTMNTLAVTHVLSLCMGSAFAGPEVIVKTVEQDAVQGQVVDFADDRGLTLKVNDAEERFIPIFDVVRVDVRPHTAAPLVGPWEVRLLDGGVLYGNLKSGKGELITFETNALGELDIQLDSIKRMKQMDAAASHAAAVTSFLAAPPRSDDCILLANGDAICGFLMDISDDSVTLEAKGGPVKIPLRSIVVVMLSAQEIPPPKGTFFVLDLQGGGRVSAKRLKWKSTTIDAELTTNNTVSFQSDRLLGISVSGGRWTRLAGMEPASFEHTPLISLTWDYKLNRNALGAAMRVAGESFGEGIGVHSRSRLTYELNADYREFVTSFGIDDDSGPHADVTVRVLVDGVQKLEQTAIKRGKLFGPIRVPVTGAKELELLVDYGANGDLQDRLDWIEPALIR